jgi:hypothetical protein
MTDWVKREHKNRKQGFLERSKAQHIIVIPSKSNKIRIAVRSIVGTMRCDGDDDDNKRKYSRAI